jgi:hypothetical protein
MEYVCSAENALEMLDQFGVAVVLNVVSEDKVVELRQKTAEWLESVCNVITDGSEDCKQQWRNGYVPSGPRPGMMQSLLSSSPAAWESRLLLRDLFATVYKCNPGDLRTSIDGGTITPCLGLPALKRDWPHVDQTQYVHSSPAPVPFRGAITALNRACIQGQLVLGDSDGSFVCSPRSHLIHEEILGDCKGKKSNWCRVWENESIDAAKAALDRVGGRWQVPISTPPGSVVLWYSATIHSAQYPSDVNTGSLASGRGWRIAYYVCLRPFWDVTKDQAKRCQRAAMQGRTTNHWGGKLFAKDATPRYSDISPQGTVGLLHNIPETLVDKALLETPEVQQLLRFK